MKIAALVIADSLTYIFNQAITLSSFPDEWKMARVIPFYKSGHRNIPGNYRPISILQNHKQNNGTNFIQSTLQLFN